MNTETFINHYAPCQEAVDWLRDNQFATIEQAWKVCERGDWMIWTLREIEYADERVYRLLAADFAEHVLPIWERKYPDDDRPRKAIQAARDYANGKITRGELYAYTAAYAAAAYTATYADATTAAAAYTATYAADDATTAAYERAWQSNKIREYLPRLPEVKKW